MYLFCLHCAIYTNENVIPDKVYTIEDYTPTYLRYFEMFIRFNKINFIFTWVDGQRHLPNWSFYFSLCYYLLFNVILFISEPCIVFPSWSLHSLLINLSPNLSFSSIESIAKEFTPLKIYNGTPDGRPTRYSRATLPINELKGKSPTEICPI
jgi:hypothetical protein